MPSSAVFRITRSRALRAASRARAAVMHFSTMRRASVGFSSRYAAELLVHGHLGLRPNLRIAQLDLGLRLELRLLQLDADDRRQPLTHVIRRQIGILLLQQAALAGVVVQRASQRGAEAGEMRAAVRRVDGIGEAEDRLGVIVGVLHAPPRCSESSKSRLR